MFAVCELVFVDCKHVFVDCEHVFVSYEHKLYLVKETFSQSSNSFAIIIRKADEKKIGFSFCVLLAYLYLCKT